MADEYELAQGAARAQSRDLKGETSHARQAELPRRGFLLKATTAVTGGAIIACPVAAGVAVFADPVLRKQAAGERIRVASLDSIPDDGVPRFFQVIAEYRDDAWNRYRNEPIGSVFLRRLPGAKDVQVFSATCPHAGCFVSFNGEDKHYECPCHESKFDVDGKVVSGPPPRGLDSLTAEIVREKDASYVYVTFEEFYTGIAEKKPKV